MRLKLKKDDRLEVPPPDLQSGKQAEDQIDKRPAETKFRKNRKSDRHIFRHLIYQLRRLEPILQRSIFHDKRLALSVVFRPAG